jgi:hypothetical protein
MLFVGTALFAIPIENNSGIVAVEFMAEPILHFADGITTITDVSPAILLAENSCDSIFIISENITSKYSFSKGIMDNCPFLQEVKPCYGYSKPAVFKMEVDI